MCVTALAGDATFPMPCVFAAARTAVAGPEGTNPRLVTHPNGSPCRRAGLVGGAELAWRRPYVAYLRDDGPDRFRPGSFQELASGRARCVVARPVPRRSSWMGSTGYKLWNCAIPLARWLHDMRPQLAGKSVLEVGAGLGVPGLYAAQHARTVILSDFEDATLRNLCCNAALAVSFATAVAGTDKQRAATRLVAVGRRGGVRCARLDWGAVDGERLVRELRTRLPGQNVPGEPLGGAPPSASDADERAGEEAIVAPAPARRGEREGGDEEIRVEEQSTLEESSFDVVLVSDTVCDEGSAWGTARAVARYLAPHGRALMCLNSEESRFGVEAFPACLQAFGLRCSRREAPGEYAHGMAGEDIMTFHLYEVAWGECVALEQHSGQCAGCGSA